MKIARKPSWLAADALPHQAVGAGMPMPPKRAPWGVRVGAGLVLLIGALASILVVAVLVLHFMPSTSTWLDLGSDLWWFVGVGAFAAVSGLGSGIGLLRGNRSAHRGVLTQAGLGLAISLIRALRESVDTGAIVGIAIAATLLAVLALPSGSRAYFSPADANRPESV